MNKLTRAEEEIMLILWDLKEATVREVLQKLDDSETPYTTVSTVIRVLEKKEFVGHRAIGTTHLYHPLVPQEEYVKHSLRGILNNYFEGSFSNMASFFARENNLTLRDVKDMMHEIKEELKEEKEKEKQK